MTKVQKLIEALVARTRTNQIPWESMGPIQFEFNLARVTIKVVDSSTVGPYLRIIDEQGDEIFCDDSEYSRDSLVQLIEEIQLSKQRRLNAALDSILAELGIQE